MNHVSLLLSNFGIQRKRLKNEVFGTEFYHMQHLELLAKEDVGYTLSYAPGQPDNDGLPFVYSTIVHYFHSPKGRE